jgi:hypothetical protein
VAVRESKRQGGVAAPQRCVDEPLAFELRELLESMLLFIV